jgi:hypothetical protein
VLARFGRTQQLVNLAWVTAPSAVVLVSSLNSVPESPVVTIGARTALSAIGCAILILAGLAYVGLLIA